MQKAPYVFPLIGNRKLEHIRGNIDALSFDLSEEDVAKVDAAYNFDPGFPSTFLSGTVYGDEGEAQATPKGPHDVWLTNALGKFDRVEGPKPIRVSKK